MLIAFQRINDTTTSTLICAERDPSVLAAMRADGHPPLPEHVEPGQTATGWAAFKISRNSSALNMLMLRRWHDGYMASQSPLLKK